MIKVFLLLCITLFSLKNAQAILLSNAIPHPYYDVQSSKDGKDNYLTILNSGIASLQARIDLIRSAQKNIEVEYFIYALDDSSKIISSELAKAAKRGVQVRVLIDKSAAVFELDKYYAKAMSEVGIDVRYYNTASLLRISSINFRNHRKLISADDERAITGGRNIEDDYFDLSKHYNFLDRDVLVEGPIAKTMRESFDEYYNHRITKTPKLPKMPPAKIKRRTSRHGKWRTVVRDNSKNVAKYERKIEIARSFLVQDIKTKELLERVEIVSRPILDSKKAHLCPETTFFIGQTWRKLHD